MADTPRKNWFGRALDTVAQTETNPLALAWRALPPNVRATYASLPTAIGELSPGAAVRDTVQASGETANAVMQGRGWDAAGGVANMLTAAAGVVPGGKLIVKGAKAANPIRAYHGSPHDFDRFDMSKIGTGEGAQAYGHGLYFAENEGVAKGYRDTLTKSGRDWGQRALDKAGGDVDAAIATIQNKINKYRAGGAETYASGQEEILRSLQQYKQTGQFSPGHMYEVQINADPAKFLDWDKPLAQQAPEVQKALADLRANLGDEEFAKMTGGGAYQTLGSDTNELLTAAGVPGTKYLDAGSRNAGDGSRNYVVFDDKLIEILRKYGLLPVAAGGASVAANPLSTGEERAY